jgi:hypothetical protein
MSQSGEKGNIRNDKLLAAGISFRQTNPRAFATRLSLFHQRIFYTLSKIMVRKEANFSKWCSIDAVSIHPAYRKPFDLIFQKVKTEEWRALVRGRF